MSFMLLGILNSQVSGGGASAFDLLETTTLTSSAYSVTLSGFSAYAAEYKHLQIRWLAQTTRANTADALNLIANSAGGSRHLSHRLRGNGSTVTSSYAAAGGEIELANITGASVSGAFAAGVTDILDFSSTNKTTTFRTLSGIGGTNQNVQFQSGLFTDLAALTHVTFYAAVGPNFAAGTRFSIYGVK